MKNIKLKLIRFSVRNHKTITQVHVKLYLNGMELIFRPT